MLEQQSLANADPGLGRFRSFILGALNHFLATTWKSTHAQKRGGGCEVISLDWAAAEERFDLEPATPATPGEAFDREWATALLDVVLRQIEQEYLAEGKLALFRDLKQTLAGRREAQPYKALAQKLGMSETALKVAVHRLRKRYRVLLQAEIAQTVSTPEQVKEELAYLFSVISGG